MRSLQSFFLAAVLFSVCEVQGSETIETLRFKFEVGLDALGTPKKELDSKYEEQLRALLETTQEEGNLDKTLMVQSELGKFREGATIVTKGFAALQRLQTIYRKTSTEIAGREHSDRIKLNEKFIADLDSLEAQLVRDTKIDEAVKARSKKEAITKKIAALRRARPDGKWQVLFRSPNPRLWNTDSNDGVGFARKLSTALKDTRYLRMRNGDESVIIPIAYEQLPMHVELGDGITWNGTAYFDSKTLRGKKYETTVLGIGLKKWYRRHGMKGGIVTIEKRDRNKRPEGFGGWGFGRGMSYYTKQLYCWAGEERDDHTFEISVSSQPLSPDEARVSVLR